MSKFIEVLGSDETWHFINSNQITKVSCQVTHVTQANDIRSLIDPTFEPTSGSPLSTSVTIRILTANGDGEVRFDSESEADVWAHTHLGIDDFIARSQTMDR